MRKLPRDECTWQHSCALSRLFPCADSKAFCRPSLLSWLLFISSYRATHRYTDEIAIPSRQEATDLLLYAAEPLELRALRGLCERALEEFAFEEAMQWKREDKEAAAQKRREKRGRSLSPE